ncbi:MAG: peptide chain release factor N(5)-glutamine methyltransferase, partial [Gammaproteobacteria bacterium]|nr:peptide chain release factor N(5)-glutamine methyltransferase [Gammaproteobacteria bacterium]
TSELMIDSLLRRCTTELKGNSPSARLDVELLLGHILRKTRVELISAGKDLVTPASAALFTNLVHRRQAGIPVAQLVGSREFWSLNLTVTAETLIPRPETEILVECALTHIPKDQPADFLDLGTGCGAVALAVASERPNTHVTATDISDQALTIAQYNAAALGLNHVELQCGSWLQPVAGRKFSMIAANPPYVSNMEYIAHHFELQHEPALALKGGEDGLDCIKHIITAAPKHLFKDGWLAIEHGYRQGSAVEILLREAGFRSIFAYSDLQGHARVTEGKLSG